MSFFEPGEVELVQIRATPRECHGAELLSIWIAGYGKSAATHLWDTSVARAFVNRAEIEEIIAAEQERTGSDRKTAARALVLRGGVYRMKKEEARELAEPLTLPSELAEQIKAAADREGLSIEDFLKSRLT